MGKWIFEVFIVFHKIIYVSHLFIIDLFDKTRQIVVQKITLSVIKWASARESLTLLHANNKGTDQTAHLRSLISVFVIGFLESIIAKLAPRKVSIFNS